MKVNLINRNTVDLTLGIGDRSENILRRFPDACRNIKTVEQGKNLLNTHTRIRIMRVPVVVGVPVTVRMVVVVVVVRVSVTVRMIVIIVVVRVSVTVRMSVVVVVVRVLVAVRMIVIIVVVSVTRLR